MMKSSSHKKRKSDINLESNTVLPLKKERPWYAEEAYGSGTLTKEKDRRKSIIGLGKGLLKKMRSSSALKERNNRDTTMGLASASTSAMPIFKQPSLNVTLDPMPDDQSVRSETSSVLSSEGSSLPSSFVRNKELVKLVANSSATSNSSHGYGEGISFTTDSCSSEEDEVPHLGSATSLCTPSRDFGRGKSHRGSARSMPPESDLIRGLCNSAIRRTFSSVSDSLASPQRFTRARSIRLREKILMSASMAELPEEDVVPCANCSETETTDEKRTPIQPAHHDNEGSSRRSSLVWSTLRSKSRIFGSRKRDDHASTPLSVTTKETPSTAGGETPSGTGSKTLRRSSASSSSIQKKVSSALRKGFGFRGSNSNLAIIDPVARTPGGIIKRSSTNSKDRVRLSATCPRRCSDVSSLLEHQVRRDQKKKEAEEARLFTEKVLISSEPVLDVLYRDGYDAVVVDVTATALPVSTVAKKLLTGAYGAELHKIGMSNPYTNGILKTSGGKPDIIYIVSEKDDVPDKRVRVGVATGMREAFECQRLKKVLFYPFCISHEEEITDFVIQQFLLASYKAFTWTPKAKTYDGTITLAGVSQQNCEQIQRMYEQLLDAEIRPRIAAVEALPKSPPQLPRPENSTEL